ncbi:hypothetical protein T01_5733 [Trichinella spiralis]|uniref:Uncharacterized protein n=1 Tax=Trichinella spiralis TaxID=6334 RepID=A0A0V1BIF2_TRISP|nr:hypothetical protein T01_5733 [Trichinella spiralis]
MKNSNENAVDTKRNAGGTKLNNKKEKFLVYLDSLRLNSKGQGYSYIVYILTELLTSRLEFTIENMNNEEKKKRKHGRFVEEADRGRHETDHRRHEADRGRHEAEQEKTKGICGSPWVPIL